MNKSPKIRWKKLRGGDIIAIDAQIIRWRKYRKTEIPKLAKRKLGRPRIEKSQELPEVTNYDFFGIKQNS